MDGHILHVTPRAKISRNGDIATVPASELVPGDIVLLERGDQVPADCRLIECTDLRIQEAALTGESEPVDKVPYAPGEPSEPVWSQHAMAFRGTTVVSGHGLGVVTATGPDTQWGRIEALTRAAQRQRPPRRDAEVRGIVGVVLLMILGALFGLATLHGVISVMLAAWG